MIKLQGRIDRQVALFAFVLCLCVLLPLGGFLLTYHVGNFKNRSSESLVSTAQVVAANISAALAFDNATEGRETLQSLANVQNIEAAGLYRSDGSLFASYHGVPERLADVPEHDGFEHVVVAVRYREEILGRLYLRSALPAELRSTILVWVALYVAGVFLAALLARFVAHWFRRHAADPLRALAQTAEVVTEHRDFSVRAMPAGPDEVVALGRALNEMLAEIGRREQEIAAKNETLRQQLEQMQLEIREREKAEQQLRETHREMVRLSREAGMAEVASGVLHNIGNVVNSLNVGVELLSEALRQHPRTAIGALAVLLDPPSAAVSAVFATHPDGRALEQALQELVRRTHQQISDAEREVLALRTKLGHLKDTVTRQQSLAKARLVTEPFDLREAVKEALLLCEDGFRLERIQVVDMVEGPTQIIADRSHVIQILLNLLRNAQTAITSARTPHGIVRIRLGARDEGRRYVSITDNGVGIATDQLTRIFSYGFTTKTDGHGFGLHSSANAARAMGGSLRVESEGPGLGATFTLELPFYHLNSRHETVEPENPHRG